MNFLDNVVKSSNALLKERLTNPFGTNKQSRQEDESNLTSNQSDPTADCKTETSTSQTNNNNEPSSASNTDESIQSANKDNNSTLGGDNNSQFAAIAADAEAVTQKAVKGAKDIGSFLFSMANKAGQTVSQTAKQVKQAVESTSILTDFTREQQEFIKEHGGSIQAGDLPWAEYNDDQAKVADVKEQILSLSQDKRNFVRKPPSDSNFSFDPKQCYPIALSLLKEDPNLSKMRFELVPKMVDEDTFWCNYFYRVSVLKQMINNGQDVKRQGWASSRSSSGEGPDDIASTNEEISQEGGKSYNFSSKTAATATDMAKSAQATDSEYSISTDNLESSESRKLFAEADDLKSKLKELNIGSLDDAGLDENAKWEEELQKDLQEFELVSGDVSALDEEALDKDILDLKNSS